jgi:hypothetical protein
MHASSERCLLTALVWRGPGSLEHSSVCSVSHGMDVR